MCTVPSPNTDTQTPLLGPPPTCMRCAGVLGRDEMAQPPHQQGPVPRANRGTELELELELELVIGALVDADVVDGAGSNTASTQYECPTASVPQVSGMDGF